MVQHRQPRLQQHHVVADIFDQQMVERDLAELVDDDGGLGERRILQQCVEQRGLAGAEEAGEHGQWDRRRAAGAARWPRARSFGGRGDFRLGVLGRLFLGRRCGRRGFLLGRGSASAAFFFLGWAAIFFLRACLVLPEATVCSTKSGLLAGPVNTVIGGSVSTGGPSTYLPAEAFRFDSMKACADEVSPLAASVFLFLVIVLGRPACGGGGRTFRRANWAGRRRSAPARRPCRARASAN